MPMQVLENPEVRSALTGGAEAPAANGGGSSGGCSHCHSHSDQGSQSSERNFTEALTPA